MWVLVCTVGPIYHAPPPQYPTGVRTYVRVTRERTVVLLLLLLLLLCTGMKENIPEVFVTLPCQHAG